MKFSPKTAIRILLVLVGFLLCLGIFAIYNVIGVR